MVAGLQFGFKNSVAVENAQTASNDVTGPTAVDRGFWGNSRVYINALVALMGIFIFGYDTGVGGGVIVLPSFKADFGIPAAGPQAAQITGNVVAILQGGCFFGALGSAPLNGYIGRKKALMISCAIFIVGAVIQTVCFHSIGQFYAGRFICGFGVGIMSATAPTYTSEISPRAIRGRVTGMFQIVVAIGVAAAYWINYGASFMKHTPAQWRLPIGFQLVPVGIMMCLLPFLRESPRWLATKHRNEDALRNLAWVRKLPEDSEEVQWEFTEIVTAVEEEEMQMQGVSMWREIRARGNPVRFVIAFVLFTCQQWSGQNSISYYAPTIFQSIGIRGTSTSLLASGLYGILKIIATAIFIAFGIDRFGRKKPLALGGFLMGIILLAIGCIFMTNSPDPKATTTSPASIGMVALIFVFLVPYCFSWGPLPWVVCSEIFSNRTRAYGLTTAAATQWLWNFAVSKATPLMVLALDNGKLFFFFFATNMAAFAFVCFIPETKGLSLESMDIVFGSITKEERAAEIAAKNRDIEAMGGSIGGSINTEAMEGEKDLAHAQHVELRK